MNTIFDKAKRDELTRRINTLAENNTAQWGKMSVYQALKHCRLYEELLLGKRKFKRVFPGRLVGKFALKDFLKDDGPVKRNLPTIAEIKMTAEQGDITAEKNKWIGLLEEHAHTRAQNVVHPFFGKLTEEQVGRLSYMHADHHLRQFNC
jgi:hypothetical protein